LFVVPILYIIIKALGERLFGQRHPQQGQLATSTVNSTEEIARSGYETDGKNR